MRTTLTLDDDLALRLRELSDRMQVSFKQLLNRAIRCGIPELTKPTPQRSFRTKGHAMGVRPRVSLDNVHRLLDVLDEE